MNRSKSRHEARFEPSMTLALGFFLIILVGSGLLSLPIASSSRMPTRFIDALFTATSAVCVTGQVVVNTSLYWSAFGKVVIVLLVQVGGLGFVTFVAGLSMLLRRRLTLKDRLVIQASFGRDRFGGMVKLVRKVGIGVLAVEALGAIILAIRFVHGYGMPIPAAMASGAFHSINAFCNAGFDIMGEQSLLVYQGDVLINAVIMLLCAIGGIGFSIWFEVYELVMTKIHDREMPLSVLVGRFSLHAKLAIWIGCALTVLGTCFFFISEFNNDSTMGLLSIPRKLLVSLFQAVATRSVGFATISQDALEDSSKLMTAGLMLIGGAPGGTAGGLKTTTLGILCISMFSSIRGKKEMEAFGRTIPHDVLQKAVTVLLMLVSLLFLSMMVLTFSERGTPHGEDTMNLFVEAAAACSTAGLATGATADLSAIGKATLAVCMFIGRLGPIATVMAMRLHHHSAHACKYPEERVFIG